MQIEVKAIDLAKFLMELSTYNKTDLINALGRVEDVEVLADKLYEIIAMGDINQDGAKFIELFTQIFIQRKTTKKPITLSETEIEFEEMKPCPFCNQQPIIKRGKRYPEGKEPVRSFEIVCNNPECIIYFAGGRYFTDLAEAIKVWNTRE